jgi:peptidoglycan/xylan/chitin deacetylase (PgdA/CDA1 family)
MARKRQAARAVKALGFGKALDVVAGSVCEVSTSRPVFHLTFDDGPHPEVTPAVLDALAESNVTATFFLLADPAKRYPEVVRETIARGHEIGLHGRTHLRLSTASWSAIKDEISKAHAELEELAGRPVKFFRPPYGAHGVRSLAVTRARGMKTILWSADTDDWKGLARDNPLQGTTNRMAAGGISLQHDTPAGESVADDEAKGLIRKDVLTREVIGEMERRGLKPVSLQELLSEGDPVRRAKVIR